MTGLEQGIRDGMPGVHSALAAAIAVPSLSGLGGPAFGSASPAGGSTVNMGGQTFNATINNGMDWAEFVAGVQCALQTLEQG